VWSAEQGIDCDGEFASENDGESDSEGVTWDTGFYATTAGAARQEPERTQVSRNDMGSFIARHFKLPEAVSTKRNYGLDALRAIAILLVVFSHGMLILPELPYDTLLFFWTGYLGVELFFVLSGYLIGTILLDLLLEERGDASFSRSISEFWIRRWFRTLPNYYLFLLVNLAFVVSDSTGVYDHWRYFFFSQNLFSPMGDLMPESWSLSIEEWFYFSFPLVVCLFAWGFGRSLKAFSLATVFYISLFVILRMIAAYGEGIYWDMHLRKIVCLRLDAIAYGASIMLLMRTRPTVMRRLRYILLGAGLAGLAVSFLGLKHGLSFGLPPFLKANLFTLTSVSAAFLLPYAVYQTELSGGSKLRCAIAATSIISYSMYLLHYSVVLRLVLRWQGHFAWYCQYILYLIFCFLLSFLVYTLFERRMTACRERYAKKATVEP
jgi:peptidoglycan/LPS O-acetylase OafA/YrhL